MKKAVKTFSESDDAIARLEEIDNKMDIISTRALWLMGIMVLIILAVANFLAKDYGSDVGAYSIDWLIKITAKTFCLLYSGTLLAYIPLLVSPKFGISAYETRDEKQIQKNTEHNIKILNKMKKQLDTLIGLFILFPTASFVVIGAGYVVL